MPVAKLTWQQLGIGLGGIALGIYPEIGIALLLVSSFLDAVLKYKLNLLQLFAKDKTVLFVALGSFCLIRVILVAQSSYFVQTLLDGVGAVLVLFFALWLSRFSQYLRTLGVTIFVGIIVIALYIFVPRFIFAVQGGSLDWIDNPTLAIVTRVNGVSKFKPVAANAYVLQQTIMQGSGRVRYQLEVRADTPFQTKIGFIQSSLLNGRADLPCAVTFQWSVCSIEVHLSFRSWTQLVIGGYSSWNQNSPTLETRNSQVVILEPPTVIDVLTEVSRMGGFSFNFNAFGSSVVVLGLVVVVLAPNYVWAAIVIGPIALCILFSGSRGAMVAFALGVLVLFFVRSQVYKVLPWLVALVFIGVVTLLVSRSSSVVTDPKIVSEVRALNVTEKDFARDRIEIWRLVTKVWLENPRSFLFGTADLTSAMQNKLDARASAYGLTKDSLTHAHNLWLQMAGQSGLLGLGAMLWLWGWVVLRAWRSRDAGALALLAAIFVINSVDYLFFYAPVHLAFWIAAVGLKRPNETLLTSVRVKQELMTP